MTHPEWLVVSAVRYALSRNSYPVDECCKWVADHWAELDEGTRHVVRLDLERALAEGSLAYRVYGRWQALALLIGRTEAK